MTKRGREAPHFDNFNPTPIVGDEAQLHIGDTVLEPEAAPLEVPEGIRLDDDEKERVDRYMEAGLNLGTAMARAGVPKAKMDRILGHNYMTGQIRKYGASIEGKKAAEAARDPSVAVEEIVKLLKATNS